MKILALISLTFAAGMAHSLPPPYFWAAKKGGQTAYLLGTIHKGLALEDMACSDPIKKKLQNSGLLFLEMYPELELRLSHAERKQLFTGSLEERKALWPRISSEKRSEMEFTKTVLMETLIKELLPQKYVDEDKEPASAINPSVRRFLARRGIVIGDSFADAVYDMLAVAYYEASLSYVKDMEAQIARMAHAARVPIRGLDDRALMVDEILAYKKENRETIPKPRWEVDSRGLEALANEYSQAEDFLKLRMARTRAIYLSEADSAAGGGVWRSGGRHKGIQRESGENGGNSLVDEILLSRRNARWMIKISQALESQEPLFIAAGLLHFTGYRNILWQLEERGFSVRREGCAKPYPQAPSHSGAPSDEG